MPGTMWTRSITSGALALAFVAAAAGGARAADVDEGRTLYLKYCSACHGENGKGDGVVSQSMRPHPNDLTVMKKEAGGHFAVADMAGRIDGRETARVHGDPDMPVWGEVLRDEPAPGKSPEEAATSRIILITEYMKSIQVD